MTSGGMNKSIREMKALPSATSRLMTMLIVVDLARLRTKLVPSFLYGIVWGVQTLGQHSIPKDLCWFYWTNPEKSNVITGLKSAASIHSIKHLLDLAKELGHPLTTMVFEGGIVTPLGLLQELHLHLTLLHIPIHMPEEVKMGENNRIPCCPICAYVIKNNNTFLNHIIIGHYWSSFSCGNCLEFVASSGQQMNKTFPKVQWPQRDTQEVMLQRQHVFWASK